MTVYKAKDSLLTLENDGCPLAIDTEKKTVPTRSSIDIRKKTVSDLRFTLVK